MSKCCARTHSNLLARVIAAAGIALVASAAFMKLAADTADTAVLNRMRAGYASGSSRGIAINAEIDDY